VHQLGVPIVVEARREEPAARGIRLPDDLDGSDRLVAHRYVNVM